ncbi:Cy102 [Cynomolgus cytomegalovirus]|nr:Cy102 [Cynomolgus cytomegalovirus]
MHRKTMMRLFLWACLAVICVANNTSSAPTTTSKSTTVTTLKPIRQHANDDFYTAHCTSHMYQVSLRSFASIWICMNVVILIISFFVVLRHCCFQNFTTTTVAGY